MRDRFESALNFRFLLRWVFVLGLLGIFLYYILFQSRLLIAGPRIILDNNPPVVQHEQVLTLTGSARNTVALTLNGRPIFIDGEGIFQESLVLEEGYTIMTITAKDRYGRETKIERPFVYTPRVNSTNS